MTRRRSLIPFAVLVLAIAAVIALTWDRGSWPSGRRVTAAQLRRSLLRSGLTIRWRTARPPDGATAIVAGTAHRGRHGTAGFEFAIAAGDHAEGGMLGHAGFDDGEDAFKHPCPPARCRFVAPPWRREDRGVLGNVAYATYHHKYEEDHGGTDALTVNALDDALFATFSRDDPRAYPVLDHP